MKCRKEFNEYRYVRDTLLYGIVEQRMEILVVIVRKQE